MRCARATRARSPHGTDEPLRLWHTKFDSWNLTILARSAQFPLLRPLHPSSPLVAALVWAHALLKGQETSLQQKYIRRSVQFGANHDPHLTPCSCGRGSCSHIVCVCQSTRSPCHWRCSSCSPRHVWHELSLGGRGDCFSACRVDKRHNVHAACGRRPWQRHLGHGGPTWIVRRCADFPLSKRPSAGPGQCHGRAHRSRRRRVQPREARDHTSRMVRFFLSHTRDAIGSSASWT